jgi:carbon monoxide dehydrogenase subunit G
MTEFAESITIDQDPDAVWEVVGHLDISKWLPFIAEARTEGDARYCVAANGADLVERIVSHDPVARRYQYTIESSPMPIEDILATISVEAEGTGSKVTWHTEVEPAELAEMFAPIYREGLDNLKKLVEAERPQGPVGVAP